MSNTNNGSRAAAIQSKIEAWLDKQQNRFELDLTEKTIDFRQHNRILFMSSQDQISMTIGFKNENVQSSCSLEQIKADFNYISSDRLPVPNLEDIPEKWQIYPQTQFSSFFDGVTIDAYDPQTQILQLHIDTNIFSIYGSIVQEYPMAGAALPPGTCLEVRCKLVFA
jgi:hypothetical protein